MLDQLKELWASYADNESSELKDCRLRLASSRFHARHLVYPPSHPTGQIRMLSNVEIHCGWSGGFNAEWVKAMVANGEKVSLRDLQLEALIRALSDGSYPYLWWFYEEKNPPIRTVYEDSLGVNFVKLNGVWQVVYNCKKLGSLVGASGHSGYGADYEKIPPNAYFVVVENEDAARRHFTG